MKLAIVGSRSIVLDIEEMSKYIPPKTDCIISGGAKGIDTCAAAYAKANNIEITEIKPDYKKYGKAAPIIRNREIVSLSDKVHIIWDGSSKGSKFVIDECRKTGKEYKLFYISDQQSIN